MHYTPIMPINIESGLPSNLCLESLFAKAFHLHNICKKNAS